MNRRRLLLISCSLGLATVASTTTRAAPPDDGAAEQVVGAFERDEDLARVRAGGATLSRGSGGRAPDGEGWLVATGAEGDPPPPISVVFELAPGADLSAHDGLALAVRARLPERGRPARLQLRALNAAGAPLFQRRMSDALRGWSGRNESFARWRWDDLVGRWSDVRAIELVAEGALALEVDHVRLLAGTRGARSALPETAWLDGLAFPDSSSAARPWVREAGALRVVGPPSAPPDEALERSLARLRPLSVWLDRVAAAAVRPLDDAPVSLFVLPDRRAFDAFFLRVGQEWRVAVGLAPMSGYTLQDFCAVTHDPALGLDRPVIIHEATHALVARRLRLPPGSARAGWLHEGLANYVQLALHPSTFDLRQWRRAFVRGVSQEGLFRPLSEVVDARVSADRYPQLASLVAFLDAERPGWIGALARGLADGQTTAAALASLKSSVAALEADWLAWGRMTYGSPDVLEGGRHFPVPPEWR
jgi:hypothetical protein